MRIIIDTEREIVIVPDTYYQQIDSKNSVLEKAGVCDKKIDYIQYIRDSFDAAIKNPLVSKSSLSKK